MSLRNILPFILIALAKSANAAAPPACLLDAINTQPNPADLRHICVYRAAEVRNEIANICGGSDTDTDDEDEQDEAQRAVAAFEEVCGPFTVSTSTRKSRPNHNTTHLSLDHRSCDSGGEDSGISELTLPTRSNYPDYLCRLVNDYGRSVNHCVFDVRHERDHHGAIDHRERDTDNDSGYDSGAYGGGG
ncbi:hypothetical protein H2201_004747 [Coniosporium apollinis]|uniref:Uncharacterized protein n=2 Tax=Coniosporium TaxID=2810619 RepID=A0ABQ9NRP4_9PEZI|nr:hypothetical protein H2199_004735 [Cladosporium sp. JES 115]KAJ9665087.1 hypothetical protein H2201_004747 [Coniosporium apollinis]